MYANAYYGPLRDAAGANRWSSWTPNSPGHRGDSATVRARQDRGHRNVVDSGRRGPERERSGALRTLADEASSPKAAKFGHGTRFRRAIRSSFSLIGSSQMPQPVSRSMSKIPPVSPDSGFSDQ